MLKIRILVIQSKVACPGKQSISYFKKCPILDKKQKSKKILKTRIFIFLRIFGFIVKSTVALEHLKYGVLAFSLQKRSRQSCWRSISCKGYVNVRFISGTQILVRVWYLMHECERRL